MLPIKKQFIKSFIKFTVLENKPGELKLGINQLKDVKDEYKIYEEEAIRAMKLLNGVQDMKVDYAQGAITILYDPALLTPQKIYKWIETLIDVGLDYSDFVKKYWEKNMDYVKEQIEKVLIAKVKPFNA